MRWESPLIWLLAWRYALGNQEHLDYGQILGDFGAAQSPGIVGIGPIQQIWSIINVRARLKAMRWLYGGAPTDFIPYGRLVELNPNLVSTPRL